MVYLFILTEAAKMDAQRKEEQMKLKVMVEKERQAARIALEKACFVLYCFVLFCFIMLSKHNDWRGGESVCRWKEQWWWKTA